MRMHCTVHISTQASESSDITAAGGKAVAVQADLSKSADIARLFDEADKAFGRLDILVNNAGVYAFQPIEDVTPDEYRRQFDLNVLGLLLASQQAAKRFTAGGNIINISSIASRAALPGAAVYAGAKAAVDAITRSLATELGPRNIRVNAINPGMVDTEGIRTAGIYESEFHKHVESQTPLGRIGQPDDVASLSSFLASDESSWMTGEIFYLSGGFRG